jgi:hypothetical protein
MAFMPLCRMGPPPRSFAADAQDCIMVRVIGPTEYKVAARLFVRHKRAPLDLVIPTTTSVLPCSGLSRYGLASPEHEVISERRPTLTAPVRDSVWTLRVGAKKWAFKSNKEFGLKEKIACREFSA